MRARAARLAAKSAGFLASAGPSFAFETFPWPYPVTDDQRQLLGVGVSALYNVVDEGAYKDLKRLHDNHLR